VIYITRQGLHYNAFASADVLPMEDQFQLLENGQTEFGPGDPGYLGGRWWIDANGNGMQDEGDTFLIVPAARAWPRRPDRPIWARALCE
jgi:hypothetical protein